MTERFSFPAKAAALTVLTMGAVALATPAAAQTACLTHDKMSELLGDRYSEEPIAAGLESNGRLLQVYAAPDGATWTMVLTTPEGASCVVAVGEDWQAPKQLAYEPET